jgi:hypothetical protein
VDRAIVGEFRIEASPPPPDFEGGVGWDHVRLACDCGGAAFRIVGWPRSGAGPGSVLWQTFSRAFREARAALRSDASSASMFELPIGAACERCGRERMLLDDGRVPGRIATDRRERPRESYRCRVCRRGVVSLRVAYCAGPPPRGGAAVEVHVHCVACHRTARIAGADSRASEQQQRLDLLYGRG